MSDRELLELAAKAAGVALVWLPASSATPSPWECTDPQDYRRWNPLTDDGDALRLAVKLRLTLILELPRIGIGPRMDGPEPYVEEGEDESAATRRAIVRAAAELGRSVGP